MGRNAGGGNGVAERALTCRRSFALESLAELVFGPAAKLKISKFRGLPSLRKVKPVRFKSAVRCCPAIH
jgi:hypothetical protein